MIKVNKGAAPPILATRGKPIVDQYRLDYNAGPNPYDLGKSTFTFHRPVYTHRTVVDALVSSHHGKCAYCEWKIVRSVADADVDHWRPKGGVKQRRDESMQYPGYYWLAYHWDNLLLSCRACNRSSKGVLFPLTAPLARCRNHGGVLAGETPAILKPDSGVDPRDHIYFVEDLPRPKTALGDVTIDVLGLSKQTNVLRRERFVALRDAHEMVVFHEGKRDTDLQRSVAKARAFLEQAVLPEASFSAMAMDFLEANPLPAKP